MSEEVRNSAITVPRILIWTIVINGAMALGFMLTILFCIGNVEDALNTPTGFPIIQVFYQATGSKAAATVMEICVIIIGFAASFANLASVSRLTWAFARDGGLPFSNFFSYVSSSPHLPL
jgi:choline transport protein